MNDPSQAQTTPPPVELTSEQRAAMETWLAAHPYGEQDENGVDLSLLRINMRLTPSERYQKHQRALRFIKKVQNAGHRS